jgi:hypothetical protein
MSYLTSYDSLTDCVQDFVSELLHINSTVSPTAKHVSIASIIDLLRTALYTAIDNLVSDETIEKIQQNGSEYLMLLQKELR